MIIERVYFQPKKGCWDAAIAAVKDEIVFSKKADPGFQADLFAASYGPLDEVVMQVEFENVTREDAFWTWWVAERGAAFSPKYDPLVTEVGRSELWNVFEPVPHAPRKKYVNWREFIAASGKMDAASAFITRGRSAMDIDVYLSNHGPSNRVVMALAFDDFNAYHKMWDEWGHEHMTPAFWAEWDSLTVPGGVNQIWEVI